MDIKDLTLEELLADAEKINRSRQIFGQIENEIVASLPSLPEMSQTELVPIVGTPLDPRNPTSAPK
jgi:hypothetical protein